MRILVSGMLAGNPGQGGASWAVMQYVLGLERLGHDVIVVEPIRVRTPAIERYFGLLPLARAALLIAGGGGTVGISYEEIAEFDAELLLNIAGMLRDRALTAPIPRRVFLDLDPAFAQIWHARGDSNALADHTHHATVGTRICATRLPLDRHWIPTLPPVFLDAWPVAEQLGHDAFTTVGHWRSYGSTEWDGVSYGQRAHSVRRLLELPQLTGERVEVALAIHQDEKRDLEALAEHGWKLLDPLSAAGTPDAYRAFVAGSKGEIGLAKAGYVDSRCGWFSDRSACYLACGRPVVAQDTGFSELLPTGEGLLSYETAAQAAAAIDAVGAGYERHRAAARVLAEEHLDSTLVLSKLLEAVL
jgi:hypothetical protein